MNQLLITAVAASIILTGCSEQRTPAPPAPRPTDGGAATAAARMSELGAENGTLPGLSGTWTVTETVWDTPQSAPKITEGLVAERRMVGSALQETLRDPRDQRRTVLRIDYLSFNRVEGRWEYVSMDTRAPVGIMTAQSLGRSRDNTIEIIFQPFALAGAGTVVTGQMLRMRQDVVTTSSGKDRKDQYFSLSDGTGSEWLAHRYEYVRARPKVKSSDFGSV